MQGTSTQSWPKIWLPLSKCFLHFEVHHDFDPWLLDHYWNLTPDQTFKTWLSFNPWLRSNFQNYIPTLLWFRILFQNLTPAPLWLRSHQKSDYNPHLWFLQTLTPTPMILTSFWLSSYSKPWLQLRSSTPTLFHLQIQFWNLTKTPLWFWMTPTTIFGSGENFKNIDSDSLTLDLVEITWL